MRSTRATSAVARLNTRCKDHDYTMTRTATNLFYLSEWIDGTLTKISEPLPLDDFVRFVDGMGPQQVRRMTKNDVAFAKQLVKKTEQ